MLAKLSTAALALAFVAGPLSAQIVIGPDRAPTTRRGERTERVETRGDARADARAGSRADHIPPGHLPPRGMCRVWIDGVPPGRQPAVTDCATAERNRTANSRVIYGDRQSFPGKGKGKFKAKTKHESRDGRARADTTRCTVWDGVVVDGRVINVCRETRRERIEERRRGRGDDDRRERIEARRDDRRDRIEDRRRDGDSLGRRQKGKGSGGW